MQGMAPLRILVGDRPIPIWDHMDRVEPNDSRIDRMVPVIMACHCEAADCWVCDGLGKYVDLQTWTKVRADLREMRDFRGKKVHPIST